MHVSRTSHLCSICELQTCDLGNFLNQNGADKFQVRLFPQKNRINHERKKYWVEPRVELENWRLLISTFEWFVGNQSSLGVAWEMRIWIKIECMHWMDVAQWLADRQNAIERPLKCNYRPPEFGGQLQSEPARIKPKIQNNRVGGIFGFVAADR